MLQSLNIKTACLKEKDGGEDEADQLWGIIYSYNDEEAHNNLLVKASRHKTK